MKKVILAVVVAVALQASAFAAPTPNVTERVMKAFSSTFNSASDILWSEVDGIYEARFTYNDILTRVRYDADGNSLMTIRYYYEQQLPLSVLTKVKKEYSAQKVHSVTELTIGDSTEFHITLEDQKNWTIVIADNMGGLRESKKLIKA
ncbi:hypothetical protein EPD60_12180 [Flaviaesturariibacter flavus]|uniref:Uncharacterized protein n=1 Tax=Flaviaesturariibacter flavus TaxID=2502780 RepID=A0A4R1B9G8_9BACT|nr:PepSY-like domain-containing protein [Flaviaesturariibacter flavus]TCJ13549.1 hypothetical protein EPD60_12180 [Flaviaesturariibacter flavus]